MELRDLKVSLEPSCTFGSHQGFQFEKILDNTVPVFRELRWRTKEDVERLGGDEILDEKQIWGPSKDVSDRQLFLQTLKTDADAYLLLANWERLKKQKQIDQSSRNEKAWNLAESKRAEALTEIQNLRTIFDYLKTGPPSNAIAPGRNRKEAQSNAERARILHVFPASNPSDSDGLYEIMLTVQRRNAVVDRMISSLENAERELSEESVFQQCTYLHLLNLIRGHWNVTKIPYETQVFQESDVEYPFRAEMWIEMMTFPDPIDCWSLFEGRESFLSRFEELVKLATIAPATTEEGLTTKEADNIDIEEEAQNLQVFEDTKSILASGMSVKEKIGTSFIDLEGDSIKRSELKKSKTTAAEQPKGSLANRLSHSLMCKPPVPHWNPFETYWVELCLTPSTAKEGGTPSVHVTLNLKGDIGTYVSQKKRLYVKYRVNGTNRNNRNKIVKNYDKKIDSSEDENLSKIERASIKAFTQIQKVLMKTQNTILENAIFYILVGQAVRYLTDETSSSSSEEEEGGGGFTTEQRLVQKLKDSGFLVLSHSEGEMEDLGFVLFQPDSPGGLPSEFVPRDDCWAPPLVQNLKKSENESGDDPTHDALGWRPYFHRLPSFEALPPKWILVQVGVAPLNQSLPVLLCFPMVSYVSSFDGEVLNFKILSLPIFNAAKTAIEKVVEVEATIGFGSLEDDDDECLIEQMSVCKIKADVLDLLQFENETAPQILGGDLHRSSLPSTRYPKGGNLFFEFKKWLSLQIALSNI